MNPSDEARWADAQAVVRRFPPPTGPERDRQQARFVVFRTACLVLAGASVLLLIGVLLLGSGMVSSTDEVPGWQMVSGLVLAGVGLVAQIWGLVVYTRTPGQNMSRPRPLSALTRGQRKELLAQVRGERPVEPDLLPLTRHLAEQQATSDRPLTANLGLLVLWAGLTVADPDRVRVGLVGLYVLVAVVGWAAAVRAVRRGRRFLAEHPVPDGG